MSKNEHAFQKLIGNYAYRMKQLLQTNILQECFCKKIIKIGQCLTKLQLMKDGESRGCFFKHGVEDPAA